MAAAASCSACEARRLTRKMSTKMIEPELQGPKLAPELAPESKGRVGNRGDDRAIRIVKNRGNQGTP